MRTKQIAVFYLFYLTFKTSCKEDELFGPRIIGGDECKYEDYPFAVAVFGDSTCGGIIISLQWVLTAAHCIHLPFIRDGKTLLRTGFHYKQQFVQERYAKKGIRHENFSLDLMMAQQPELRYDIGLILSNRPFNEGKYLKPVLLPTPGFSSKCNVATAVGIGYTETKTPSKYIFDRRELNSTLNCVELPIVDAETCKETWSFSVIDSSIVCTRVDEGGRDACAGDSGGGLYCGKTVIGIVSAGKGCAAPKMSATFTKVEAYLDFIEKTMRESRADKVFEGWANGMALAIALTMFFY